MEPSTEAVATIPRRNRPAEMATAVRRGAGRAVEALRPEFTHPQQEALSAGTNAVIGTLASIGLAAFSGLLVGRVHPLAPQILYAISATLTGVYVTNRNRQVGTMLVSGGMVACSALAMKGVASLLSNRPITELPEDPFSVAEQVGRTMYDRPDPTGLLSPPTPRVDTVAPTAAV